MSNSIKKERQHKRAVMFCKSIASEIRERYELELEAWKEPECLAFFELLRKDVIKKAKANELLLALLVSDENFRKRNFKAFTAPDPKTFERYFIKQNKKFVGSPRILNAFAIWAKNMSYEEYLNKTGISKDVEDWIEQNHLNLRNDPNWNKYGYISSFLYQYDLLDHYVQPTLIHLNGDKFDGPIVSLLDDRARTIIHSDSFTGKTTLLKYLSIAADTEKTILLLPLAKYQGSLALLAQEVYGFDASQAHDLVYNNKKTILLLDAFDEIPENKYRNDLIRKELDAASVYSFIMTSRSKFIADVKSTLQAIKLLRIDLYDEEQIFLFVDKLMKSSSRVMQFHLSLRNGRELAINMDVLKYPWLIMFLKEHYDEGNQLTNEFFLTLPIAIFEAVKDKLESRSELFKDDEVKVTCFEIGNWLFNQMQTKQQEITEVPRTSIKEEHERFFTALVQLGAANVTSLQSKGAKGFHFTIPNLHLIFIAFYLSKLNEEDLMDELKEIYYNPVFQEVVSYALTMKANSGEEFIYMLNVEKYTPDRFKSDNQFELFYPFGLLRYLPSEVFFVKNFNNIIPTSATFPSHMLHNYFQVVQLLFKSDLLGEQFNQKHSQSLLDLKAHIASAAQQKNFLKLLPLLIEKNEVLAEQFGTTILDLNKTVLHLEYENAIDSSSRNLVHTKIFQNRFMQLSLSSDNLEFSSFLAVILASPKFMKGFFQHLWMLISNKVEDFCFQMNKLYETHGTTDMELWGDHMNELEASRALILRGGLEEKELYMVFDYLDKYYIDLDEESFFKSPLEDLKSSELTSLVAKYILEKYKRKLPFYSIHGILYIFSKNFLFDTNNENLKVDIVEISKNLITELKSIIGLNSREDGFRKDRIIAGLHAFSVLFLGLRKIYFLEAIIIEQLNAVLQLGEEGEKIQRRNFAWPTIYLMQLESEELLGIVLLENPIYQKYFLFVIRQIQALRTIYNFAPSTDYLEKFAINLSTAVASSEYPMSKDEIYNKLIVFKRQEPEILDKEKDYEWYINDYLTNQDYYSLSKAALYPEFEQFLSAHPHRDFKEYAFIHSFKFDKPLFLQNGVSHEEVFYIFSSAHLKNK